MTNWETLLAWTAPHCEPDQSCPDCRDCMRCSVLGRQSPRAVSYNANEIKVIHETFKCLSKISHRTFCMFNVVPYMWFWRSALSRSFSVCVCWCSRSPPSPSKQHFPRCWAHSSPTIALPARQNQSLNANNLEHGPLGPGRNCEGEALQHAPPPRGQVWR